jgi:hypothetical protein
MVTRGYVRSSSALSRQVGDETLVTRVDRESLDVLAGTAGHIWRLLEQPRTVAELVEILAGHYRADPERIRRDVDRLLEDLVEREWLRPFVGA